MATTIEPGMGGRILPGSTDLGQRIRAGQAGQVPVAFAKLLAALRSTNALTPPNTAPSRAAAKAVSVQPRAGSVAPGASSSPRIKRQICLNTAPATMPPATPAITPQGLYMIRTGADARSGAVLGTPSPNDNPG